MTRYEAYIEKDWEAIGLGMLLIVRVGDDGIADLAGFLVDSLCLGVKDAFFEGDLVAAELQAYLDEQIPDDFRERIHPACARKLIDGAVAYAEGLGFAPHREYRKARRILSGVDAGLCPRDFTYGSDGRPCYVRGADDDEERVNRICGILEAKFGPDGFDYEDPQADQEEELAERDELIAFLDAEAPEVPRFYELSGLITAMLIAAKGPSCNDLLPLLWPEGTRAWRDQEEVQQFLELLQSYWNQVNRLVLAAVDPGAPPEAQIVDIWAEDFTDDETSGLAMSAITMDWAKGFLRATEVWPDAWGDARERADLAPYWEVLGWWAEYQLAENRDAIIRHAESDPPRTLNASVKALARALRPPLPPTT